MKCTCCELREAYKDGDYCVECQRGMLSCVDCGTSAQESMGDDFADDWFPGDEWDWRCERCQKQHEWNVFKKSLVERLEAAAEAGGWDIDDISYSNETNSVYYTLERSTPNPDDEDEDGEYETLKVRISDHGDAYCTSDYSLVMPGNETPEDHDIEKVLIRISNVK